MVLGGVERAEHRLLAGHARRVPEAPRLRGRRRASGPCRRRAWAGPTRRGAGRRVHCGTSSSTACAARTTPRGRSARRSTSSPSTPRDRRGSSTGTCGWASPTSSATIDQGFAWSSPFPELKDKPIVIGESDPEAARPARGPQLGYRNGTMYSSYTAAIFARTHRSGRPARGEPGRRADVGVRVRGSALLRRLPRAGEQRDRPARAERLPHVRADGRQAGRGRERRRDAAGRRSCRTACAASGRTWRRSPAWTIAPGWACWSGTITTTTCPGPAAAVSSRSPASAGGGDAAAQHYRIDDGHSNAFTAWQQMGSPAKPTPEQYKQLEAAGRLAALGAAQTIHVERGGATLPFELPRAGCRCS